jgi:predicted alpha/beta superfamily hydrolase
MNYLKANTICTIIILILTINNHIFSQTQITGKVIDTNDKSPLAYVNIGIKEKNTGTISKEDGSFSIDVPSEYQSRSLTFSIVGYYESNLSIRDLISNGNVVIQLKEKPTQLEEVVVTGKKPVEKKYGIKRRGAIHFTDGIFKKDDSFEIGQVIRLGNSIAQITSLNLHINSSRPDSANFRINFYRYDIDENIPKERIIEKSILQRHPVNEGWLKFDLSNYNILIKGDVLMSLEFIPETDNDIKQIFYEVKLGGSSKSFFRKTSLGQWTRPPHHYCLYATATTDKNAPDEPDDEETPPAFTLKSDFSNESFSFFVRLPKNYSKTNKQTYPVIYLLDGNAYFDQVSNSLDSYIKKKKVSVDPIVVGIGYENAYVMDSLRNRDYTFPEALPADSFKISGQGDKFYNFIKTKLVTYIDSAYRTDKSNRTIMGHSLGGYFVLYALNQNLSDSLVFSNFIAASPSIYYHDNYLAKEIGSSQISQRNIENIKIYLTIGELEVLENQTNDFEIFSKMLSDRKIKVQTEVYKGLEHMGTAIPTFESGIQFLLTK